MNNKNNKKYLAAVLLWVPVVAYATTIADYQFCKNCRQHLRDSSSGCWLHNEA